MDISLFRKVLVFGTILLFFGTCIVPTISGKETVTDSRDDVIHWDGDTWTYNIFKKQDIDILDVSYDNDQYQITLSLMVNGSIVDSEEIAYQAYYTSLDARYHLFYSNGEGFGMVKGNSGDEFKTTDVDVSENKVSCKINIFGSDTSNVELYGYVYEYTKIFDVSEEYWVDFAPDNYFRPDFINVDDDFSEESFGWQQNCFDKIQHGIDIISEQGTINVKNGTYEEELEICKKGINLISSDMHSSIIASKSPAIRIKANEINISGFTFQQSEPYLQLTGIRILSDNNIIHNNKFENLMCGVWIVKSSFNEIRGNVMYKCEGDGITIEEGGNNILYNNELYSNENGIYCKDCCKNSIYLNRILSNTQFGIIIKGNCHQNIVKSNEIIDNYFWGVRIQDSVSFGNLLYDNIFIDNGIKPLGAGGNAYSNADNIWNLSYKNYSELNGKIGNYWDDHQSDDMYKGEYPQEDLGEDNISDEAYQITGSNYDYYPIFHTEKDPMDDHDRPRLEIVFPEEGHIYFFGFDINKLMDSEPFPFLNGAVIIGSSKIKVFATDNTSGIKCVEFWTDPGGLQYTDSESEGGLYEWKPGTIFGSYTLLTRAFDNANNPSETKSLNIIIYNIGVGGNK